VIILLGCLLLMIAFRSIVVPLTAAAMNLLAAGGAFGIVTAVFQWGWGSSFIQIGREGPVEAFLPVMLLAILFGLSMDYQVFLMSQIEHARARYPRNHKKAIAVGLATGARVISAAALIMIAVFGSFILNGDPTVKQFGVGLSVGVALAALTVLVLAPALLVLAGKTGTWWIPKWAERVVPHIDIEGAGEATAVAATGTKPTAQPKKNSMKL
jgi:RND superfamily putative drug exporter